MRPARSLPTLLLLTVVAAPWCTGARAWAEAERTRVVPHEPLVVGTLPPAPAAVYRRLEALVDALQQHPGGDGGLDGGDLGPEPRFAPHEAPAPLRAAEAAEAQAARAAFRELVATGPLAVPTLLAHLDDARPLALVVEHAGGFGGLWASAEIDGNPALPEERAALLAALPERSPDLEEIGPWGPQVDRDRWRAAVGDACFAALGQIVNRGYLSLRGQPTNCLVVNSPLLEPRLAAAVRAQWAGRDPRQELARRLWADLHTTSSEFGRNAGDRQAEAVRRLLVWYAPEAGERVRLHLARLRYDGRTPEGAALSLDRLAQVLRDLGGGGLGEDDRRLLARLSAERLEVDLASNDPVRLFAALEALSTPPPEAVFEHAARVLAERGPPGAHAARELATLARLWPARVPPLLARLVARGVEGATLAARLTLEHGLLVQADAWRRWLGARDTLVPEAQPPDHRAGLRLCDVAGAQLVRQRPELAPEPPLLLTSSVEVRDRALFDLSRRLRQEPPR